MDWLVHNPIADLSGPEFLVLYGLVIAATLIWCWWQARQGDPTTSQAPPPVPADPDPYEIGYLRGGENEVTRLAVFSLLERGYLQTAPALKGFLGARLPQRLEHAAKQPDSAALTPIERRVFEWFTPPRSAPEIFQGTVPAEVKRRCAGYEQRLRDERLLMPPEAVSRAWQVALTGAAIILGLGAYKLVVALSRGHSNVAFLIIMAVVSLLVLRAVLRVPRLTRRGRAYLQQLRLAYEPSRTQLGWAGDDGMLPLMVGLFGLGVLAGTPFDEYRQMFPAAASSGASCGGSCGSSSGCGSGGGDGGGGCGGCGGGGD